MTLFFTLLQVFLGIMLIIFILLQNSSADSVASFSSSYSSPLTSFKSTSDLLAKYTWVLAVLFFVATLCINFIYMKDKAKVVIKDEVVVEKQEKSPSKPIVPFDE